MDELSKQLSSPAFWVCGIVFAFAVNILAAYAKTFLDSIGARLSRTLRAKRQVARDRFDARVTEYAAYEHRQVMLGIIMLRHLLMACLWLIGGGICVILQFVVGDNHALRIASMVVGFLGLVYGISYIGTVRDNTKLWFAAGNLREKKREKKKGEGKA